MEIKGKKVLVTGGGSGIGLAISQALLNEGATVIICGRNEGKLKNAINNVEHLQYIVCDVTNDEAVADMAKKIQSEGGIDIIINNAGIMQHFNYLRDKPNLEMQLKEIDINVNGPIRMIHHFLPQLTNQKEAAIVNISSGLAFISFAPTPVYSATKAGLHAYTEALRWQLKDAKNLHVFELMPPAVQTDLINEMKVDNAMSPQILAKNFIKGLQKNNYEIVPGQSKQLKIMRRLAPGFIFKMVNKQFK